MVGYDVLVVGAGQAGGQAAIALRQNGFEGKIAIIGDEPHPPYERPPLSKEYLAGSKDFERLLIRPSSFWGERSITLILNRVVAAVHPDQRYVTLADGTTINYRKLIWAGGGVPRRLPCPGGELERVHVLRSRADVDRIRPELATADKIVVIGGGYVGLEAAAVLVKLGKKVVLLEALDRVLARVAGADISRFYEAAHRAQGVDLRTGVAVECVEGKAAATGVRLASGELIAADMVIVGIGIVPAIGALANAGAEISNGVNVDGYCRTSMRDIYAVGDCAAHESRFAGGTRLRVESVQNANDQATTAAKHIVGIDEPYAAVPWFWSNQYDLKLQTVGLSTGHDETVVRGEPGGRSFSVVYLKNGRVVALDCVNAVRDYVQGRKLVLDGTSPSRARLADASIPLKEV